ncbi:MAG TPA: hypothetical protein VJZ32_03255 [Candidatus Bathyarchaeia archaeon]|nr:hypothetical protein [Candidatus Bathyarchaeia archaeon]
MTFRLAPPAGLEIGISTRESEWIAHAASSMQDLWCVHYEGGELGVSEGLVCLVC